MADTQQRATVYFDPALHRALRIKAAETDRSLSDIANEAVKLNLLEDAEDLAAFDERATEQSLAFEDAAKDLKSSGSIWAAHQGHGNKRIAGHPKQKRSSTHC